MLPALAATYLRHRAGILTFGTDSPSSRLLSDACDCAVSGTALPWELLFMPNTATGSFGIHTRFPESSAFEIHKSVTQR